MYKWILKSAATAGMILLPFPMHFRKHMSGEYLRYVQGYVNDTNRLFAYICCVPPGMKTRNLCVWGHVIFGALDIITFDTTTLRV